jgi:hypothetical protein
VKGNKHMKIITNSIYPAFAVLALACFALPPTLWAVDPAPDGGYPNANTAEGEDALFSLTTAFFNTAVGFNSLFNLSTGNDNTAVGNNALFGATQGNQNVAIGSYAAYSITTGEFNTAVGTSTLQNNLTGDHNTAIGWQALELGGAIYQNTAIGSQALLHNSGNNNTAVGRGSGSNLTTGNNNIDVGNSGVAGESDTIRIGTPGMQTSTFIAGSGLVAGMILFLQRGSPQPDGNFTKIGTCSLAIKDNSGRRMSLDIDVYRKF